MYVVMQRVVSPTTRETGINAFLYMHPGRRWQVPPGDIPGQDPGRLERRRIAVVPKGNRVRSHLDVVAPDDIEISQMRRHLLAFAEHAQFKPFPWEGADGPCAFRIDMVPQLVTAGWARETRALAAVGLQLLENARRPRIGPTGPSHR
jgi:hypothetical protein